MRDRVGPLWRIKQALEEIQGGNTQCEHPERKSLRGSGNTIPQESGCLLHSGDQIPWWQLSHNQGQWYQVQALLVRKWQRHCWCRSVCGRRVDRESFWGSESLRQNHFSETHSRPVCGYLLSVYAPQSSGEFPLCTVCHTGVGSNSIFCNGCKHWVHKKCSGLKCLKKDCTSCQGTACPLDGRPQKEVQGGPDKLEVVASFCYLGDMLSAAEGCELSTTTCVKSAWKKFKDLLPVLSSHHLSFKTHGRVYSSCVWSAMLHANET